MRKRSFEMIFTYQLKVTVIKYIYHWLLYNLLVFEILCNFVKKLGEIKKNRYEFSSISKKNLLWLRVSFSHCRGIKIISDDYFQINGYILLKNFNCYKIYVLCKILRYFICAINVNLKSERNFCTGFFCVHIFGSMLVNGCMCYVWRSLTILISISTNVN